MNYTCTNLADHLDGPSHDAITDDLRGGKVAAREVRRLAKALLENRPAAYLILDDSVQAKPHSRVMELVKRQYSGNVHGLVKGIGVVNLIHSQGTDDYPIDFRVYAPPMDGLTKNEHFRDLLRRAYGEKEIQADTVLFDSWYAAAEHLKFINRLNKVFVTILKENRLVSPKPGDGYFHLQDLDWTPEQLQQGISVKLKEVPFNVNVQLFKVVAPNGNIDWVITYQSPGSIDTPVVQQENTVRWMIEQQHRELKQLTGIEKCQCRKQRVQRTHISCCYQAWFSLKVRAKQLKTTLYHVKQSLWSHSLRNELRYPRIPVYQNP